MPLTKTLPQAESLSPLQAGDAVYLTDQSLTPPEPALIKDTVPSPTGYLPRSPAASASALFFVLCGNTPKSPAKTAPGRAKREKIDFPLAKRSKTRYSIGTV